MALREPNVLLTSLTRMPMGGREKGEAPWGLGGKERRRGLETGVKPQRLLAKI
jgi:hypothetical protein